MRGSKGWMDGRKDECRAGFLDFCADGYYFRQVAVAFLASSYSEVLPSMVPYVSPFPRLAPLADTTPATFFPFISKLNHEDLAEIYCVNRS